VWGVGVAVPVGVGAAVSLLEKKRLPELLAEGPSVNEAVGEALTTEKVTEAIMPKPVLLASEDQEIVR
jgi:hypothetical protein